MRRTAKALALVAALTILGVANALAIVTMLPGYALAYLTGAAFDALARRIP